jgi:hypothetical protein
MEEPLSGVFSYAYHSAREWFALEAVFYEEIFGSNFLS